MQIADYRLQITQAAQIESFSFGNQKEVLYIDMSLNL